MNKEQFNTIKLSVRAYMETLNLNECKDEIIKKGLLTTNTKLAKGEDKNILNYGLELLPSVLSPVNTCKGAGKCKYTCLAFSGVGNIFKSKKLLGGTGLSNSLMRKARLTFVLINDKEWFDIALKSEIQHKNILAELNNQKAYFRLNVTSDLDWFHISNELKEISFYDYTKVWSRKSTKNYRLTYSASELVDNFDIMERLSIGENVAMVFFGTKLPKTYFNFEVIDGDKNDNRFLDGKGKIVGLLIKTTVGGQDLDSNFFYNV